MPRTLPHCLLGKKSTFLLLLFCGALLGAFPLSASTLQLDFDETSITELGWESVTSTDTDLGDSWSKNLTGGITVDADPIGAISLDSRDRATNGTPAADMWRDFLFANGSTSSVPGSGISITVTGLDPNTNYPISIHGFDKGSPGNRRADWNAGADTDTISINGSPLPTSLTDYTAQIEGTTDGTGTLVITGIVSTNSPSASHNVFINGLQIGNPIAVGSPTDLHLSNLNVSSGAPIGTTVGTFTTTDPTAGDSHTYSFASGAGDDHNGEFLIDADILKTDRDLSALPGPLLVRIRTTDLLGNWHEKPFVLPLTTDSDGDGLGDSWELGFFPSITTANGTDDNDGDTLDNLAEQALGTSPILADTDGDTLSDALENGSGIFNGPSDPGSSPLFADTDSDGLNDADEISAANGHITNPNLRDSDGDGFPDPLEIQEGTDPNDVNNSPPTALPLVINEIIARNETGIEDGFDKREDWVEIYNPNNTAIPLAGYFLTDTAGFLTKWTFPNVTIAADGYLLVFASGANTIDINGELHTNFQLSAAGEYLAIVQPNGSTIEDSLSPNFPPQFTDISYGRNPATGALRHYASPTPRAANAGTAYPGVVKDTNFSQNRGIQTTPALLYLTSATPGATIRYTLDGSAPSLTNGNTFSNPSPLSITTTTTVRARAFFSGWLPTNIDTHTYLFTADIVQQPTNPPGWPSDWGYDAQVDSNDGAGPGIVPSDYEMDPRIVNNTNGLGIHSVEDALIDIPSVSITMDQDDFTGPSNGIWTHPTSRWERTCSMEYILPDGSPGFQEDCKIEIHGNSSRAPWRMQKHSMRVTFSGSVGVSKLDYRLFPDTQVDKFDQLVLRACFTDSFALNSWSETRYRPNDAQYLRDIWMKDSLADMGQPSSHGNFVHLYVNGLYFGLHNLTERIKDDFLADHLGGAKEDWIIYDDFTGKPTRWNNMMAVLNEVTPGISDPATYASAQTYLDVENYADYMLLHFYADAEDWPHHNGYAAANELSGDGKFRFLVWDQEIALDKFTWNRYTSSSGGGEPFQQLILNDEFRLLFADRVQRHLFHGGALSESGSAERYLDLANGIDKSIVAETARWGDVQESTPYGQDANSSTDQNSDNYPPTINDPIYWTREQHWVVERDNIINWYIPILHDPGDSRSIVNELRSLGTPLFPSIDAPSYSPPSGTIPSGQDLEVNAPFGTIYYTLDGSDPRLPGGAINPAAGVLANSSASTTLINLEETNWRYLDTGIAESDSEIVLGHPSYNSNDWKHPSFNESTWGTGQAMLGYGSINGRTINTTVDPPNNPRYPTTYFRKTFNVTNATDFDSLNIRGIRDDGVIIYLNGREVARSNMDPGNTSYGDFASTASSPEGALILLGSHTLSPGDLIEGNNVLAVELHNSSINNGDLAIDIELEGIELGGGTFPLAQSGTVKTRALHLGEWSALNEQIFTIGVSPAPSNLVVTEIYYNPPGSSDAAEFIELMNIDPLNALDLSFVSIIGIGYTFPDGFQLDPLQRVVIARDQSDFLAAYPGFSGLLAPGDYTPANLSNSGEELTLLAADASTELKRFTYDDLETWPISADGDGYSLVLIAPSFNPPHGDAASWRPSTAIGGNPGSSDSMPLLGDPFANADGDHFIALLEHATGNSDNIPTPFIGSGGIASFLDGGFNKDFLTFTYQQNLAADDVLYAVQISDSLNPGTWDTGPGFVEFVSFLHNGNGTATLTYRSSLPISDEVRQFMRLEVTQR